MTENSERCCTCTTPEITIKLNKQGPQGLTGPQGEPGFSPVIEVSEETPTSYKLSIQTEEGSYETPNLKATIPTGGYTNQVLTKNSNADGDCGWNYIPYATEESTGGVQLATTDDVVVGSDKAITGDILAKVVAGYVDLTSAQTITGAKTFSQNLNIGERLCLSGNYTVIANNHGNRFIALDSNNNKVEVGEGSFNLTLRGSNINIVRNNQAYTNIDSGNIRNIISDTANLLLPTVTFLKSYLWDTSTNTIIESIPTSGGVTGHYTIGNVSTGLRLHSAGEIKIRHNSTDYTNLDSGNISSDPYIQSLVARIEALES